jgi:hypothetical protein
MLAIIKAENNDQGEVKLKKKQEKINQDRFKYNFYLLIII